MSSSKQNGFRSTMLAIIFLFLNGVCIASPGIKNITDDCQQVIASQPGHDLNNSGSEENQPPAYSFKNYAVQISATPRNYTCNENFYSDAALLPVTECCKSSMTGRYFLPKPGYYTFLFRYKPFWFPFLSRQLIVRCRIFFASARILFYNWIRGDLPGFDSLLLFNPRSI